MYGLTNLKVSSKKYELNPSPKKEKKELTPEEEYNKAKAEYERERIKNRMCIC